MLSDIFQTRRSGEGYVATLQQMKTPTTNNTVPWKEQFWIIILRAVATVVKNVVTIVNVKIYYKWKNYWNIQWKNKTSVPTSLCI